MSSPTGLPLDATITIVNNSGKLISTGKQLLSIWKTAQTSYREKKTELSEGRAQERAAEREKAPPPVPVKRAQTFDTTRSIPRRQYDELSVASSARTYKSSSVAKKQLPPVPHQLALTEGNLEKLSEVGSVAPSKLPSAYGGNNISINNNNSMVVRGSFARVDPPMALQKTGRTRSDSEIEAQKRFSMGSDLHLAYGDIPPDLADRVDLDKHTAYSDERTLYDDEDQQLQQQHVEDEREQAEQLIHKIENLLDEASCAQHSATAIITHLQERPDAAAAVALTLAELSGIITKLSPGFAAILKGTSPAIFALLASPQFLIGTGIAVGVTVVMFGGWKIVQRIAQGAAKKPMAYEAAAAPAPLPQIDNGVDEAIVLETVEVDISSIDTWRRGITTEFEVADMELMTPEADRVVRERRASGVPEDYFGSKARKSSKTQHRSKTHSSSSAHSSSSSPSKSSSSHRSKESSSDKKSSSSSSSGGGRRKSDDSNASGGSLSLFKRSLSSKKKSDEGSVKGGGKNDEMSVKAKMRQNNNMLKALFKSKEHRQSIAA
ncbi:hypothetical protein ACQKWADRAFT_236278 [Trichoderma austrokoningii]